MSPPLKPFKPPVQRDEHRELLAQLQSGLGPLPSDATVARSPVRSGFRLSPEQIEADIDRQATRGLAEAGIAFAGLPLDAVEIAALFKDIGPAPSAPNYLGRLIGGLAERATKSETFQSIRRHLAKEREEVRAYYGDPVSEQGRNARFFGRVVGEAAAGAFQGKEAVRIAREEARAFRLLRARRAANREFGEVPEALMDLDDLDFVYTGPDKGKVPPALRDFPEQLGEPNIPLTRQDLTEQIRLGSTEIVPPSEFALPPSLRIDPEAMARESIERSIRPATTSEDAVFFMDELLRREARESPAFAPVHRRAERARRIGRERVAQGKDPQITEAAENLASLMEERGILEIMQNLERVRSDILAQKAIPEVFPAELFGRYFFGPQRRTTQ